VVGGPISDWPTSASTTATRSPRAASAAASRAVNEVLPVSLAPRISVTRARAAASSA